MLKELIWIFKDSLKLALLVFSPFILLLMMAWLHNKLGSLILGIIFLTIALFGVIWCILIIRDPTLTKEEKWKRLWGK